MLQEKAQQGILQVISEKTSREITKQFGSLTTEKILEGNYPSLAKIKKEKGEEYSEKITAVLVLDTAKFFDSNMDIETAKDVAVEIGTMHYYLTLEDLFIVLQEMKQSEQFGKLTPHKILVACKKYSENRMETAAKINYNKHLQLKEGRGTSTNEPDEAFQKFYHEYEVKRMAKEEKK